MSHRRRDTLPKTRKNATGGSASQRRISRREREARQRRQLYIGLAVAAILSVAIVSGFALNEYIFKPRAVLASVNGVDIQRRDYWKVRSVDLINQINQYNQFAQMVDATQQQQYYTLAQQASEELDDVWGSTDIDDATLTRMVEDQVYLQSMDDLGVEITDQDIQNYLHAQFQPADAPIFSPTPTPTLVPQRATWATETEVALRAEEQEPTEAAETSAAGSGSPVAQGSPMGGSPVGDASPVANASPLSASPVVDGSPAAASPVAASPVVEASPVVDASPDDTSPVIAASPVDASPVVDTHPLTGIPEIDGTPLATVPDGSPVAATPVVEASPVSGSPSSDASPVAASPGTDSSPVTSSPVMDASPVSDASPLAGSPESAASPVSGEASPVMGSPVAEASPASASPISDASPVVEATATVFEEPTPNPTQAIETAEAGFEDYQDVVFDIAHLSEDDYIRLIVRPAVAREKAEEVLLKDVGQTAEQVKASHILVDTKDLADSIYAQLQGGADFAQTAREQSNDTATAENGGDLGWFTRGQMVEAFENTAFGMQPGEISQPFQTQFGWHIVHVVDRDPNRAMTDQQIQQYRDSIVSRWLTARQAEMDISSKVEPTPTAALSSFVPPPDAPALPTPTDFPTETVAAGSPVASPVGVGEASPVASPVTSSDASPVASPAASPGESPAN